MLAAGAGLLRGGDFKSPVVSFCGAERKPTDAFECQYGCTANKLAVAPDVKSLHSLWCGSLFCAPVLSFDTFCKTRFFSAKVAVILKAAALLNVECEPGCAILCSAWAKDFCAAVFSKVR